MLTPVYHGSFKKERKLMHKRGKNLDELTVVMRLLINEQSLLPRHENHLLHGDYNGWWECHVEPDWLLIYRIDKDRQEVIFKHTGSHSDMF
jgi:mRNA interferase YafQ